MGRQFNMYPILSSVYWDLILEQSDAHLLNGKQPWWSLVKSSCLFALVFRIQPSYYFVEKGKRNFPLLLKRNKKDFFAFITDFAWILSTLKNLFCYHLQLQIWFQIKQINTSEISCVTTSDKTATFTFTSWA